MACQSLRMQVLDARVPGQPVWRHGVASPESAERYRGNPSYRVYPCGKCNGCRFRMLRERVCRVQLERLTEPRSCFVTLTYSPENMPAHGSIEWRVFSEFIDRLQAWSRRYRGCKLQYIASGEYGDSNLRPHYHLILVGVDFGDASEFAHDWQGTTRDGRHPLFSAVRLSELWPYGFNYVGSAQRESIHYVARYTLKKAVQWQRVARRQTGKGPTLRYGLENGLAYVETDTDVRDVIDLESGDVVATDVEVGAEKSTGSRALGREALKLDAVRDAYLAGRPFVCDERRYPWDRTLDNWAAGEYGPDAVAEAKRLRRERFADLVASGELDRERKELLRTHKNLSPENVLLQRRSR